MRPTSAVRPCMRPAAPSGTKQTWPRGAVAAAERTRAPVRHQPRHTRKQREPRPEGRPAYMAHGNSQRRARHKQEDDSRYGEEPHSPYYPAEVPSYHRYHRRDNPDANDNPSSGYGSRGWPDCWGTCFAGKCRLEGSMPGYCHLNRAHGRSYASAAAVGSSSGSDGGSVGDAHTATTDADGVSSSRGLAGVSYKKEGDSDLVCWRDAERGV